MEGLYGGIYGKALLVNLLSPASIIPTVLRENFLVLDIFFEALNYEAIEQKKAYNLAGLLGE